MEGAKPKDKLQEEKETGVLQIANSISKVCKVIKDKHKKSEDFAKELEQVKALIVSEGKISVTVGSQAIIRLYDESILTSDRVQSLLMPLLTNSRYSSPTFKNGFS